VTPAATHVARFLRYAFDATGRRRLTEEDFVRIHSFERRWVRPALVRLAVAQGAQGRLLERRGDNEYVLGFGAEAVRLPFDYAPDSAALERELASAPPGADQDPAVPLFRRIVRRAAGATGQEDAKVVAAVNQQQAAMGGLLTAEVAAILYGRLQGVDVDDFIPEAWRHLTRR
jgi:hypothetical protein